MLDGSILQKLKDNHRSPHQPHKRPLNFGVYYKNTLVALCHALEDAILTADYQPLMITAFQRGKWYLEEAERYGEIAEKSDQVVILASPEAGFAEHPTSQKANVALVSLDKLDPVSQEWHLIIVSPNYTAMVLCQELSDADYGSAGLPQRDLERKFYGFWTFEPELVLETAELAIDHVQQYNPDLHQQLAAQVQSIRDRIQHQDALCGAPTADHLGAIVSRVVNYLQTSEENSKSLLGENLVSNELQAFLRVAQLIDQTDLSNPMAAAEVATLAEAMGQLLDLPSWQLHRLRLAGLLHRLAFLQGVGAGLSSGTSARVFAESPDMPLTCPLVPGIQVLRRMPRLRAIATILTHQWEWWNGTGQPAGLTGDEIPVESRILSLIAAFQQQVAQLRTEPDGTPSAAQPELLMQALAACQAEQGNQFDPKLVEALGLLVSALQQGLSLPIALPKIAAGLWLLDPASEESLQIVFQEAIAGAATPPQD
ncbi:metal-dependent phosphohydrolase [Phormidium tenue FACHB-886]|nr:metal-dependent phosphohydrolase [Phormidium tenue FACHB-886]